MLRQLNVYGWGNMTLDDVVQKVSVDIIFLYL